MVPPHIIVLYNDLSMCMVMNRTRETMAFPGCICNTIAKISNESEVFLESSELSKRMSDCANRSPFRNLLVVFYDAIARQ